MIPLFPPNDEMSAFLRACQDAPEDDAPRLIFADYLEENGHSERAAFIRLQCEIAQRQAAEQAVMRQLDDEEDCIDRYAYNWLAPWRNVIRKMNRRFTRGLIDLTLHANGFATSFRMDPNCPSHFAWVDRLSLFNLEQANAATVADYLTQIPELHRLALRAVFYIDQGTLGNLLQPIWHSPSLNHLRDLELENLADPRVLRTVAHSPQLTNLDTLRLHSVNFDRELGELFADPRCLPSLKVLHLANCYADADIRARLHRRFGAGLIGELLDEWERIPF